MKPDFHDTLNPSGAIKQSRVDVLVIGAGPSGVICANALVKAGLSVRIVDLRLTQLTAGYADGLQHRSQEIVESYGLGNIRRVCHALAASTFYGPGPSGGIERKGEPQSMAYPAARFPFGIAIHQGAVEKLFTDSMEAFGTQVERGIVPVALQLSDDESILSDINAYAVQVKLMAVGDSNGQFPEVVHAKFVVGSDGAHSWVRKSLGIAMEGSQTEYTWGAVDMIPDTDFPDIRKFSVIQSSHGACLIIPRERNLVRIYMQLSNNDIEDPATNRADLRRMNPERLLEAARKSFYPYTIGTPEYIEWWTAYTVGQRVASRFSARDRVFIIGDACHTHSPKGGQGMNAGLADGHNLAWKIAQVLRGWAGISLLQTYELERRQFAQELITFDKTFAAIFSAKAPAGDVSEMHIAIDKYRSFMSGTGVQYGPSCIVDPKYQSCAKHIIVGQRMPPQILIRLADFSACELHDLLPADVRFKILVFTGDMTNLTQMSRIEALAAAMSQPTSFAKKFAVAVDVITVASGKKNIVDVNCLPQIFRSHWTKVFVDDIDLLEIHGGKAYTSFGIEGTGAIVVVRPDGHVGFVCPLDAVKEVDQYFTSFMTALS